MNWRLIGFYKNDPNDFQRIRGIAAEGIFANGFNTEYGPDKPVMEVIGSSADGATTIYVACASEMGEVYVSVCAFGKRG